jgi:integrase/recombinase XerD
MLEKYFVKPQTVDRVRACWIGAEIERYVEWLCAREYADRTVWHRVPVLVEFGEFARARGADTLADLPVHVDAFVAQWAAQQHRRHPRGDHERVGREVRGPIEQLLELVVADFGGRGRPHRRAPFTDAMPGFFEYLAVERGLRPVSIDAYRHHLARFEDYLTRIGLKDLTELSPTVLAAFVAERRAVGLAKTTVRQTCGMLRVFLRYGHREGVLRQDLSGTVDWPQVYRLSDVPRSISWAEVGRVLAGVDRRTPCGKRDYAILLLLISYGLRGREVAALTLDDIDWKRERLAIPERKAGHSTAFPLSTVVGAALVDYLRHARPDSLDRHVFFRAVAPVEPIGAAAVCSRARYYLLEAGVEVPRPGSHTLRHTCVQRLVDADFPLKTIGDFVGHRSPASTQIYGKVAIEPLRRVALGDGEEVLR